MRLGLNLTFIIDDPDAGSARTKALLAHLTALGCLDFRIQFRWRQFAEPGKGGTVIAPAVLARWKERLALLPPNARILGYVLNAPVDVAVDYFHDQSTLAPRVAHFFEQIGTAFPEIGDWEVGNEPNASDFYLSVKDGAGHRPWRPEEFVRDFLVPGARALKKANAAARICVGAMAEDGMAGHFDRAPALANLLPNDETFRPMRSDQPHGRFYFVPDFLPDLLRALRDVQSPGNRLFDAVAFHPYPYFNIHQSRAEPLAERSEKLVNGFLAALDRSGLAGTEAWITEVGARSLVVPAHNIHDESEQATFLATFHAALAQRGRIARLYWYKFADMPWDMVREKTFGLVDHFQNRKASYHAFRAIVAGAEQPLRSLSEDFEPAARRGAGAFDPRHWETTASTTFTYAIAAFSGNGKAAASVFAGRWDKDWWCARTRQPIGAERMTVLDIDLGYRVPAGTGPVQLAVELTRPGQAKPYLTLRLVGDPDGGVRVALETAPDGPALKFKPGLADYPFARTEALTGVNILFHASQVSVTLAFGTTRVLSTLALDSPLVNGPTYIALRVITRKLSSPGYVLLDHVRLSARHDADERLLPALPLGLPAGQFDLRLDSRSQIAQEEWVLRMLRFRRGGFFVEVGGFDGTTYSNSVSLERDFDWSGLIIEPNPRWFAELCGNRRCPALNYAIVAEPGPMLDFVDAAEFGGLTAHLQQDVHAALRQKHLADGKVIKVPTARLDELLSRFKAPALIDYMSIDTEGSETEVLRSIDFSRVRCCLLTVEHAGIETRREEVWQMLKPFGFRRLRVWFEDWFWHPQHLATRLGIRREEAEAHAARVNATIPSVRRNALLADGRARSKAGEPEAAARLFLEGTKAFYPDNILFYLEAAEALEQAKQAEAAVGCVLRVLKTNPHHPAVLRRGGAILARNRRYTALLPVLDRMLKSGNAQSNKAMVAEIVNNAEELASFVLSRPELARKHPLAAAAATNN